MHDPQLERLVAALDSAVERTADRDAPALHADVEVARLRLLCLNRRLGAAVAASPYLAFVQRLVDREGSGVRAAVAASA